LIVVDVIERLKVTRVDNRIKRGIMKKMNWLQKVIVVNERILLAWSCHDDGT
jgi:hypothetical protein